MEFVFQQLIDAFGMVNRLIHPTTLFNRKLSQNIAFVTRFHVIMKEDKYSTILD
jgi:hypothetical protein